MQREKPGNYDCRGQTVSTEESGGFTDAKGINRNDTKILGAFAEQYGLGTSWGRRESSCLV
jgi:hypothetical protein